MNAPIYLDYNATTPVDPLVADTIEPYLHQHFGNPSSTHVYGRNAHQAVERAREQVAILIGAQAGEIIFAGCATEARPGRQVSMGSHAIDFDSGVPEGVIVG